MRPANATALLLVPALIFAVGCGMEAVDTRIQARSESGLEQYPVEVVAGKYVCPHVVTVNNQPFDPSAVQSGEVEDTFGPFVPCGTIVEGGEGECPSCGNAYRTSGSEEDPDSNDPEGKGPRLALPLLQCPHCTKVFHPVAALVKGSKDSTLGASTCPNPDCRKNVTMVARDLVTAVDNPEETLCPSCKSPLDPMMNACTDQSCKLGGVVRNVRDFEGPCWRCGGLGDCPNCSGAGMGNQGIYGTSPTHCWICQPKNPQGTDMLGTGECPECDGTGFSTYEGQLPPGYKLWARRGQDETALPDDHWTVNESGKQVFVTKRGWQLDGSVNPGGGSGGGDMGGDERMDDPPPEDSGGGEEESGDSEDSGESGEEETPEDDG